MARPFSRVEQEAREAEKRARELEKEIRRLSEKVSHPQRYFSKEPDERAQSTAERFRRYFIMDSLEAGVEKRRPTRAEKRAQRNRAIIWSILAVIILIWVLGYISQNLR